MSLFDRLLTWLRRRQPEPTPANPDAATAMLLGQIEDTREVELSCDDVLAVLDQFAESALRGEDAAALMPLVQYHLDHCPDCHEEFEALLRVLKNSHTDLTA